MPHRCVAGGCSNTAKDGVSLHGWPTNAQLARQWTNAVRNTRANFNQTASSKLCSSHFSDDSFETQSVIAQSLGLKMKKILKPDAVPTIFHNCPPQKRQRREHSTDRTEGSSSPAYGSRAQQFPKQPRGAYRKREAARVRIADYLKLALFCKCNPQRTNVNLITSFFLEDRRWTRNTQFCGILWRQCRGAWKSAWSWIATFGTGGSHTNTV